MTSRPAPAGNCLKLKAAALLAYVNVNLNRPIREKAQTMFALSKAPAEPTSDTIDRRSRITQRNPVPQVLAPKPPAQTLLSRREVEVLTWVAFGKSNGTIADILGISIHTVDTHVRRIMSKLDVASRTTAAVRAAQQGVLPRV